MSDLRGISRGSKTAAVVVLVVLLQVIVVAVLGLGAIARDREEGARIAWDEAEQKASATAQRTLGKASDTALKRLGDLARSPLPALASREDAGSLLDVFRVDSEGRVRAADGTPLHVPAEVIEAAEQRVDRTRLDAVKRILQTLRDGDRQGRDARRNF